MVWHNHGSIFNRQSDCRRQTHMTTFGGGEALFIEYAPSHRNPSYYTELIDSTHRVVPGWHTRHNNNTVERFPEQARRVSHLIWRMEHDVRNDRSTPRCLATHATPAPRGESRRNRCTSTHTSNVVTMLACRRPISMVQWHRSIKCKIWREAADRRSAVDRQIPH